MKTKEQPDQNPVAESLTPEENSTVAKKKNRSKKTETETTEQKPSPRNKKVKPSEVPTEPITDTPDSSLPAGEEPQIKKKRTVKAGTRSKKTTAPDYENREEDAGRQLHEESIAIETVSKEHIQAEVIDLEEAHAGEEDEEDLEEVHPEEIEETIDYYSLSRAQLVDLLQEIVREADINTIKKRVALIKVAYLKITKEEQEKQLENMIREEEARDEAAPLQDELEVRFNALFDIYKEKRSEYLAIQEKIKKENLDRKLVILEDLKLLIESEESLKKTYDEFRNLQDKWKAIGMVPKGEVNYLWQSYHFLVERFFDKVKINKELRDLDLKKNLELKIELCEKAEELLLESSVLKSFKELQKLHSQWKEIGPVPQDKKEEIWDRFKNATDQINQRRREHYTSLKDDQLNNLAAKTVLCDKAEEILQHENGSIREWQEQTDKITELLKVWKSIGPAPRAQNDDIWNRFKTSLDAFYAGKKEYFQQIKEEQLNNFNLKVDLCNQAEALKTSTDWKKTTNDLIRLQQEWKSIGPVPKKHSDRIWKRFRAACDDFFNAKASYFSNIRHHEAENLRLKEELIRAVENFEFNSDKNKNLETLKDFQRQWTEIGHVPIKDKERLQNEFRNVVNRQLDKLKINKSEMQTLNYKQRFVDIKERPNAERIISNELNFLHTKRKKLEEDVKLWENNIGFLASSKKADLLREEFEKKINKVKDEIKLLTEKIKFLERETG